MRIEDVLRIDNGGTFVTGDLHIHSFGGSQDVKDQTMTPQAIIDTAVALGLSVISITDHNTDANVVPALQYAQRAYSGKLLLLPGVEITTAHGHLLVYFNPEHATNVRDLLVRVGVVGAWGSKESHTTRSMADVISEAERLGGLCIAAHIDRVKTGFEALLPGYPNWKKDILKTVGLYGLEFDDVNHLGWYSTGDEPTNEGGQRKQLFTVRQQVATLAARAALAPVTNSDAHDLAGFKARVTARAPGSSRSSAGGRSTRTEPAHHAPPDALRQTEIPRPAAPRGRRSRWPSSATRLRNGAVRARNSDFASAGSVGPVPYHVGMHGSGSGSDSAARIPDEGDVGGAVLQFAASRPTWMQDAMRRLAMVGQLDRETLGEVLVALKAQHGLAPAPPLAPMSREHVRAFTGRDIRLLAIKNPKGVNRIASGQVLTFAERGITLVYGDNGSGKTSYFRILTGVCSGRAGKVRRGQERGRHVLGNVYDSATTPEGPEATLRVSSGGHAAEIVWRPNEQGMEALQGVHIFDQFAVPKYVDEDCSLEFVPFGLQVFDDLVELCRGLEVLVQQELDGLRRENDRLRPAVEPNTPSARFVAGLDHRTTDEQVQRQALWTTEDEVALTRLEAALGDARHLVRLTEAGRRIDAVRDHAVALDRASNDEAMKRFSVLLQALVDAEATARRVAEQGATDAPLGGIGSEPWRVLFRAARRFSAEVAYPGEPFPHTGPDSRCVLCHQALDEVARHRMRRFEAIAGEEAERDVTEARRALDEALAQLPTPPESLRADLEGGLAASSSWLTWPGEALLFETVGGFQSSAEDRVAQVREARRAGTPLGAIPAPGANPVAELTALSAAVSQAQTTAHAALQGRAASEGRRAELRARKSLSGSIGALRAIVENQITISRLEACKKDLNTRTITTEGIKLKNRFIGSAFQVALEAELRAMNLSDIAVTIAAHGERGVMLTRLRLAGATTATVLPGDVLSRGEQQVMAIACFLAELRATGTVGAVVFDDPISSLDHDRRKVVARRLAKLATERQVIVLTHDVAFVYLTHDRARIEDAPCELRTLEHRRPLGAGIVSEGLPFRIKKVDARISELKSQDLPRLRKAYESGDADYARSAVGTLARLRGVWECAIEERLFNGVVRRFQHDVKTSSLEKVPVPQELKDMVHDAMSRLSREVHDEAAELTGPAPTPADFEGEIEALREFVRRVGLAAANAGAVEQPSTATGMGPALSEPAVAPVQHAAALADSVGETVTSGAAPAPSPPPALECAPPAPPGSEPARRLRLVGVGRDHRGRAVRREWDEAAVLSLVAAARVLDQARRDLNPVSLEQFLQRRNRSGMLPYACIAEGRKVSFFYAQDDLETHLERQSRRNAEGGAEHRVLAPGDREGLERALTVLQAAGLDLSDLGNPGEQRPAAEGQLGELFAGASARWALELDGRDVPVFVLGELRQLVERPEVAARVGRA